MRISAAILRCFVTLFYEHQKSAKKSLTNGFGCSIISKHSRERIYRGVEQLVARRAHNPEVVWFKSHPRNHSKALKQRRFKAFFFV